MIERFANFCPRCGTALVQRQASGALRPVCPECGYIVYFDPKVAVVVFIVQDGEVLLVKRAGDPGMGKWALPAGFVDAGEDPAAAAIREMNEETGLQVEIDALLDVFPRRDNGLADIIIAYRAHVSGGSLQAADDAADARWYTRDKLPELVFYPSITLLGRWKSGAL